MPRGFTFRVRRVPAVIAVALAVVVGLAASVAPTHAQDRAALTRHLSNRRSDFRLRVQAAFGLGNLRDARAVPALSGALHDPNPAVRAAAATALGRIASPRALPALRTARRDSSAAVRMQVGRSISSIEEARAAAAAAESSTPGSSRSRRYGAAPTISIMPRADRIQWPRVRYVVTLGDMENRSNFEGNGLETTLRAEVTRALRVLRGVAVMQSEIHLDDRARREMRRRRLPSLRLDGSIAEVQRNRRGRDVSVRCEISLMLLDGRRRSLRGELRGAATGTEPRRRDRAQRAEQEKRLAERALQGAVRSAMSNASQALERAANH
ncbi:MAG: hypothetical protein DRJ42_07090 [Deltaproteobacteria bacterium]|nr:MAG: hypothetical protein DRJ42_07090 [Deltaproteobacteria bacterium]